MDPVSVGCICVGSSRCLVWLLRVNQSRSRTDAQEFRNSIYNVLGITFDNQTIQVMMQYMDADGDG